MGRLIRVLSVYLRSPKSIKLGRSRRDFQNMKQFQSFKNYGIDSCAPGAQMGKKLCLWLKATL